MSQTNLNEVINNVETLLRSPIALKEISESTGISESVLKKLSSGEREVTNAKFEVINQLYQFYLENKRKIFKDKSYMDELSRINLPKNIRNFIKDLSNAIDQVNNNEQEMLYEVKTIYIKDKQGYIEEKGKCIAVDEHIALNLDVNTGLAKEPYDLKINTVIADTVDELKQVKIVFDEIGLENALKQIKYDGGKIKLSKEKRHIMVYPKGTSLYEYNRFDYIGSFERMFFSLEYNQEKNYRIFNEDVSFNVFIQQIIDYLGNYPADPKGERLAVVRQIIIENGYKDTEDFLNRYIFGEQS
ncbi:TPA: hypothetical protein ACNIBJ_002795 [Staphylococcus aureus]